MSDSIMPRAGSVPTQGVSVQAATSERKRGQRGDVGKGTPGKRLKSAWRRWRPARQQDAGKSLRQFARLIAISTNDILQGDAQRWLASKGLR